MKKKKMLKRNNDNPLFFKIAFSFQVLNKQNIENYLKYRMNGKKRKDTKV